MTNDPSKLPVAIFVAATGNYLMYLNALVCSIAKRGFHKNHDLTLFLLYHDNFPETYLKDAQSKLPFKVECVDILRSEVPHPEGMKRIEFVKRARYHYMMTHASKYDVVCLMDADMYFVSEQFPALFDMVADTPLMIGCNERYKWEAGENYSLDGEFLFHEPRKLYQMHCNVPAILDVWHWRKVFELYSELAFRGTQTKDGKTVGIGDIMAWNLAVEHLDRAKDVVVFPMESMTQVHQTNRKPWTHMMVDKVPDYPCGDYWHTFSGERVYSIHGRIAQASFVPGNMDKYDQEYSGKPSDKAKMGASIEKGLRGIQQEWYNLNYKGPLRLCDYVDELPEWKTFNKAG